MAPAAHRRGTHCTRLPQTSGQLQGRRLGRIERERETDRMEEAEADRERGRQIEWGRCTCRERRQDE